MSLRSSIVHSFLSVPAVLIKSLLNQVDFRFIIVHQLSPRLKVGKKLVPEWLPSLPSFPPLKLPSFWPMIDATISDQLPESHKMACKAYRYDFSEKKSAIMVYFVFYKG